MPIIDIPGVGEVEFPDSMGDADIEKAAKKLHFEGKVKAQQEADKQLYNPASSSFMGNILPGAGAQVASAVRALGGGGLLEKFGLPSTKEEADRLDAPLNAAPGSTTGRVLGGAALLAPTAFIPGANTLLGSSLIGAGTGAATTEGDAADRLTSGLLGAGGGLAGNLLGRAIPATWGAAKGLLAPFMEKGRERIAGRTIQRFATDPAALAAAKGGPSITGAVPTLAEATRDPGIATLQRVVQTMDPDAAASFLARSEANNAARVGTLTELAGSGGQREFFDAARNTAAQDLYGKAFATDAKASLTPGLKGEITKLLKRPDIQEARKAAMKLAANSGEKLSDGSIKGMHFMKLALDDMIDGAGAKGIGAAQKASLISNRDRLVGLIENLAPDYAQARTTYAAMSKPLNQMDVAQRLLDSTRSASADLAGNRSFQAASYARALNNEESLLKSATGRKSLGSLEDVLDPDQLAKVRAVQSELDTVAGLDKAAGGPGSQTAKMLASQNLIKQVAGPLGMPESWVGSVAAQTAQRPVQFVLQAAEPRIHAAVAKGLLDPAEAKRLVAMASAADSPSRAAALLQKYLPDLASSKPVAGLLGYQAAQANNK